MSLNNLFSYREKFMVSFKYNEDHVFSQKLVFVKAVKNYSKNNTINNTINGGVILGLKETKEFCEGTTKILWEGESEEAIREEFNWIFDGYDEVFDNIAKYLVFEEIN